MQFIGKSSVGSGNILWRRFIGGCGLQTLSVILRVVGGENFLKLVMVFGLVGLAGHFRCSCHVSNGYT